MNYVVTCACGAEHAVTAAQAGAQLPCDCGATMDVPLMSVLRRSARVNPTEQSVTERNELSDPIPTNPIQGLDSKEQLRWIASRHRDLNVAILFALAVMAAYYFVPISPIVDMVPFWRLCFLAFALFIAAMQCVAALRCASVLFREIGLPMMVAAVQFAPTASILVMGISHQPNSLASISFYSSAIASIAFLAFVSFAGYVHLERNGLKPGLMGVDPKTI